VLSKPDEQFSLTFPAPSQSPLEITIEVSRTLRPTGDTRELGMVFGTFALR
jgi:hypothetical protein